MRVRAGVLTVCTCGHADAGGGSGRQRPAWKPDKAIELIAINAPGGGSDRILRIMAKIMQEAKLADVPINIVNKPGGGGSVAFAYANQQAGNGHYLVMANKSLLTNNLVGRGPSYTEFTAVAKMFNEYIAVAVTPDSPLKSGRELIERLKKDPGALSLGVATSFGNLNHQGVAAAFKDAGIDARKVRTRDFSVGRRRHHRLVRRARRCRADHAGVCVFAVAQRPGADTGDVRAGTPARRAGRGADLARAGLRHHGDQLARLRRPQGHDAGADRLLGRRVAAPQRSRGMEGRTGDQFLVRRLHGKRGVS